LAVVVRMALAVVLGVAAASKLRSPRAAADGLATFGVPPRLRLPMTFAIASIEGALAIGVAAGSALAAYLAGALVVGFALLVAAALARGAGGAPCGCFGARSRVGVGAVVRDVALAAALVAAPSLPSGAPSTDGWLLIGLIAAFACIAALAIAVLALARELGMLRLRLGSESALDVADEGPPLGERVRLPARLERAGRAELALAIFSSEACRLCHSLKPVITAFRRDPLVAVEVFDEVRDADVWRALRIPGSPFAVAFDRHGTVNAKGTFNTYGQLESILAAAERRLAEAHA
jgi:methylamine utilization protein MauE